MLMVFLMYLSTSSCFVYIIINKVLVHLYLVSYSTWQLVPQLFLGHFLGLLTLGMSWLTCKSLWIKASAKWQHVNVKCSVASLDKNICQITVMYCNRWLSKKFRWIFYGFTVVDVPLIRLHCCILQCEKLVCGLVLVCCVQSQISELKLVHASLCNYAFLQLSVRFSALIRCL